MATQYIDKEDLFKTICDWQDAVAFAEEQGVAAPLMPNKIGSAILEIAEKLGTRYNFNGYSYIDEMIGDGILMCTRAVPLFDRTREQKNPFGFFTFICWRAFVNRIENEKKYSEFKGSLALDETVQAYERGEFDEHEIGRPGSSDTYGFN